MIEILVIEDEGDIRESILDILEAEKFEAIAAPNGKIGVELARKHTPNLIICDVNMPELDGFNVISTLRQDPSFALTSFIFLTAMADRDSLRHAMNLGADDYLSKPVTRKALLEAVNARLNKQAAINRQARAKLDALRSSISLSLPHELITPLSGILGLAEILIDEHATITPAEVLEIAQDISASGQRLNRLIQNFITYARLETAGTDKYNFGQTDRPTQIADVITRIATNKAKSVNREADLLLDLEDAIVAIPEIKLEKILEEAIDNAFKYSNAGTPINISSRKAASFLTINVCDRGRGMTAEQIADLGGYMQFERKLYEQQGAGLGLAIAKRMTELYGGKFEIDSEMNTQTTVRITLAIL
ncbi:MAG: hybrid sensor histidine kinase/response regulator [Pseudanabaena sp. CRU_2_10]|nr:hybrid sensor histidine kinase/response regulator [Pseudanabaena sp. CRU_2_10]